MTMEPKTKKILIWSGISLGVILLVSLGYKAYAKNQQAKEGETGTGTKPTASEILKRPVVAGGGIKINPALLVLRCKSVDSMSRADLFKNLGIPYRPAVGGTPDKILRDQLKQKWKC